MIEREIISSSPEQTFELGAALGKELRGGEVILLTGGLGAGKTLLTKGILSSLDFDVDEVTSPSFALVNLYQADRFNVYHIDLWRSENGDAAFSVGLEEIVEEENAIVIIEWAERLGSFAFHSRVYRIDLSGDGEDPRTVAIRRSEATPAAGF
ncbi:MAG TPA: tRNA (adenosine(37)-N6)-threonylcarbamoyltransferase complex ATPase subunit type 1 TsaE [Pyrinomonadaceae bacterium]|nr:tRNA (adenosine(37)-N6)-threonylcarbamoyltransferase complex ATPase subunit type 1 TsaE [Pyrinomonadaceae bacterium]